MLVSSRANFISYIEAFPIIISGIFFVAGVQLRRFTESDFRLFAKFAVVYLVFITVRFLFLNNVGSFFYFSDLSFLFKRILFAFLYCAVLKEKAVEYFAKIIVHGAMVSLFFYPLQLINGPMVFAIGSAIHLPPRVGNPEYTNFLIFTYDGGHHIRNCGFAWEPGAWGCYIVMGLLLHFLLNRFKMDKHAWILVISGITTLSTTAYLGLLCVFLLYYRVRGGKLLPFLVIAVPILAVVATQLPFLLDKIEKTYSGDMHDISSLDELAGWYDKTGEGEIHLNRFGSAIILWNLFRWKLIWGISNGYQGVTPVLHNVNISNGDVDFFAKFGVVGFAYLMHKYILLLKSFIHKNEYMIYCVLIIIVLAFGEPMLIFNFTMAFLFLYHYVSPETLGWNEEEEDEDEIEEVEYDNLSLKNSN
jgi:hypothetical protein